MVMLEFYNGVKGCINKAFLRNRKTLLYMKNHVYCICKAWPSFCHLPNFSQLTCGHFAGTNQNGRNKQGSRKNSVTVICKTHFLQSHAICLRVLDCRKISACSCLRDYEKSDKVLLFFSNVKGLPKLREFRNENAAMCRPSSLQFRHSYIIKNSVRRLSQPVITRTDKNS